MVDRSGPMACPVDGTALVMSERQNIEIDYCPTCRGVWLDRGELDKIIERSAPATIAAPSSAPPQPAPYAGQPQGGYEQQRYYGKRKKSFLEELFD